MLETYEKYQEKQIKEQIDKERENEIPSGVSCTEKVCGGEMMVKVPVIWHPELKKLRRAHCGKCDWLGWI